MVMLDEPMAGVNPALTQSLLGHIQSLREDGMTVLFVEHDMDVVRDIARLGRRHGRRAGSSPRGHPTQVMADQAVIDAYLGAHHDADARRRRTRSSSRAEADSTTSAGRRHR